MLENEPALWKFQGNGNNPLLKATFESVPNRPLSEWIRYLKTFQQPLIDTVQAHLSVEGYHILIASHTLNLSALTRSPIRRPNLQFIAENNYLIGVEMGLCGQPFDFKLTDCLSKLYSEKGIRIGGKPSPEQRVLSAIVSNGIYTGKRYSVSNRSTLKKFEEFINSIPD